MRSAMQVTIGANCLRNTDGIISIRGRRQIVLEWGPWDSELLLTMDLYGANGGHIARLRRNQWTFNDHDRFAFAASTEGFHLVDTKSSDVVLEARVSGPNSVVITQGAFFTAAGQQIDIGRENLRGDQTATPSPETRPRPTSPPFATDEIAAIRTAVESSQEPVACPRCACPLTTERIPTGLHRDRLMVWCRICRRTLVIRGQS